MAQSEGCARATFQVKQKNPEFSGFKEVYRRRDLNSPTIEEPLKNGLRQRAILGSSIVPPQRRDYASRLYWLHNDSLEFVFFIFNLFTEIFNFFLNII